MDAFLVLLIVIVIICWSCYRRNLSKAAYGIAALDIFLRIVAFIATHIGVNSVSSFLGAFPDSLLALADKYTSGLVFLIIAWSFIILMIYFLGLIISTFFRK